MKNMLLSAKSAPSKKRISLSPYMLLNSGGGSYVVQYCAQKMDKDARFQKKATVYEKYTCAFPAPGE